MTNPSQPQPAPQDLDETSLDLVTGAGIIVDQRRGAASARQQEQEAKATPDDAA